MGTGEDGENRARSAGVETKSIHVKSGTNMLRWRDILKMDLNQIFKEETNKT